MNNLLSKDRQNIWHPFTPLGSGDDPILITAAEGIYLHAEGGRSIMDAISSWWVNLHGHSHPAIAAAVAEQAARLEHVIFAGFTHEPAIRLAENLLKKLPDNQQKIFFSDNGSTAVEVALKMAFQYWHNQNINKKKVIALRGAYHGDTFGAMSVGERGMFSRPFSSQLFDVAFVDVPHDDNIATVKDTFEQLVKPGDVCSFIFEPLVQGAAGMKMYRADHLDELMAIARAHDVICIADEVFTGFGRTGKWFASLNLQSPPDIMTMSKGLTGGAMPLGATSCSGRIISGYANASFDKTFFHGHSFTANPLACAAANASYELLARPECAENIAAMAAAHRTFVAEIAAHAHVREARSLGTILAIELDAGHTAYDNDMRGRIYKFFLSHDILLRPLGNIIYALPPYVTRPEELNRMYDVIRKFLATL